MFLMVNTKNNAIVNTFSGIAFTNDERCCIISGIVIHWTDYEATIGGHKQALIDHYTFLLSEMEPDALLLSHLQQFNVLDEQEVAEIRTLTVRQSKNEKLINFLLRTTTQQYVKFLEALQESKQYLVHDGLLHDGQKGKTMSNCMAPATQ